MEGKSKGHSRRKKKKRKGLGIAMQTFLLVVCCWVGLLVWLEPDWFTVFFFSFCPSVVG